MHRTGLYKESGQGLVEYSLLLVLLAILEEYLDGFRSADQDFRYGEVGGKRGIYGVSQRVGPTKPRMI
jgi:hypothetical protein